MIPAEIHLRVRKGSKIGVSPGPDSWQEGKKIIKKDINHSTNYTPIHPSGMKVPCLLLYSLSLGHARITAAEHALKRTLPMAATKPMQGITAGYHGRDRSWGLTHAASQSGTLQPVRDSLTEQHCSGAKPPPDQGGLSLPADDALPFIRSVTGFFIQLSFLLSS